MLCSFLLCVLYSSWNGALIMAVLCITLTPFFRFPACPSGIDCYSLVLFKCVAVLSRHSGTDLNIHWLKFNACDASIIHLSMTLKSWKRCGYSHALETLDWLSSLGCACWCQRDAIYILVCVFSYFRVGTPSLHTRWLRIGTTSSQADLQLNRLLNPPTNYLVGKLEPRGSSALIPMISSPWLEHRRPCHF